jgi:transcriptional regulator with XRE-family HTH domain
MGKVIEFQRVGGSHASKPLLRHMLGEVLRGERLDQERILTEVAATAGVSPQYLSEIERGRKEPSSEILGSVAEALGLELVDVVSRVAARLGAVRDGGARRHPLDLTGSDAGAIVTRTGGAGNAASADVFLLAA